MTETDTTPDELEREKDRIWELLIKSPHDSKEGKQLEGRYVDVCRRIRRLKS